MAAVSLTIAYKAFSVQKEIMAQVKKIVDNQTSTGHM